MAAPARGAGSDACSDERGERLRRNKPGNSKSKAPKTHTVYVSCFWVESRGDKITYHDVKTTRLHKSDRHICIVGKHGKRGFVGAQGEKGVQGEKGAQGSRVLKVLSASRALSASPARWAKPARWVKLARRVRSARSVRG